MQPFSPFLEFSIRLFSFLISPNAGLICTVMWQIIMKYVRNRDDFIQRISKFHLVLFTVNQDCFPFSSKIEADHHFFVCFFV